MNTFGGPSFTPAVKALVIINLVAWFFLVLVLHGFFLAPHYSIFSLLGLLPNTILNYFTVWQFFTYMFIHASGVFHILFNMLVLWMFGSELERLWGPRFFVIYYMVCGVGAAIIYFTVIMILSRFSFENIEILKNTPVVGSSGAMFGLMLAYGWLFKDRVIYAMLFFPIKARNFAILIMGIELLNILNSKLTGPVSNLAHVGGMVSGFLFLIFWRKWSKVKNYFQRKPFKGLKIVRNDRTWN